MPAVYKLAFDEGCQALVPVDPEQYARVKEGPWKFDGYPLTDSWRPIEMRVNDPSLKKPDIWSVGDTLAFEPHVVDLLEPVLLFVGELLPLPFEDRTLMVFNVTKCIEVLDKKNSVIDPVTGLVLEYAFNSRWLGDSIFKIPQTREMGMSIYVLEGISGECDEVKPLIRIHGLAGLQFKKLFTWET